MWGGGGEPSPTFFDWLTLSKGVFQPHHRRLLTTPHNWALACVIRQVLHIQQAL